MKDKKIKILVAKPGLDGHDKGAKMVALALKDAGMDVIYTGLHKTLDQIISAAKEYAVDAVGLSIMTGAHLQITGTLLAQMKSTGMAGIKVFVGGVIPVKDIETLKSMGVAGVFPGGTPFDTIVSTITAAVKTQDSD